ncbi:MAG: hypothetical protein WAN61_00880 [Minisyncoccia bacterium]
MATKNKKMNLGKKMVIGAGMAALAEGAYYLLGPNSKKHQKKTKVLMDKVKKEVKIGIEKGKKLEEEWKNVSKKATKKPISKKKR